MFFMFVISWTMRTHPMLVSCGQVYCGSWILLDNENTSMLCFMWSSVTGGLSDLCVLLLNY